MLSSIIKKFQYGNNTVILETGLIARQANAAVMVSMGDTTVLVTVVVSNKEKLNQDCLSFFVSYQERTYAAGRFPGGFFRREGRPSENETLISRLIDRPMRPLFPKDFFHEVQLISTVISVNPQINPDIVAIIGASAALSLSGIPYYGPVGAARVGYIDNEYVLNPSVSQLINSSLDLVVSGTENAILMVESEAKLLTEEQMLDAIIFGHMQQQIVIENINEFVNEVGKSTCLWQPSQINIGLRDYVCELAKSSFYDSYFVTDKYDRNTLFNSTLNNVVNILIEQNMSFNLIEIKNALIFLERKIIRNRILREKLRIDGRSKDMVRGLDVRISVLPRTHGSALFTRGNTQSLVTVTLGTERNAQNVDELTGERTDRFLLHYNFPPYCVGEVGIMGSPKRREIGHGRLAKRGILAVMPSIYDFPYTVRVVSEITESNGSSSMASICGASLALMDAGVPIKSSIAGVAMGLIKEDDNFIVLSDIIGCEDKLGDMDFKVAGNRDGITALQMDIKTEGITREIIYQALKQAKYARISILDVMDQVIKVPRKDISEFAPRIHTIKINPEKIKNVIGKGGSVIRTLTEQTGTTIEIEDDGTIKIAAIDSNKASNAIHRIKEIIADIEVGCIYRGKVTHIVEFGAFVAICGSKEGLVHISQLSTRRVHKVTDYLRIGQEVSVKVLEIDRLGRLRLSMKDSS